MTVLTLLANKWLGPENERSSEWEEVRQWWPLLSEGEAFCPRRAEKVIENGHAENNADSTELWGRDKQAGETSRQCRGQESELYVNTELEKLDTWRIFKQQSETFHVTFFSVCASNSSKLKCESNGTCFQTGFPKNFPCWLPTVVIQIPQGCCVRLIRMQSNVSIAPQESTKVSTFTYSYRYFEECWGSNKIGL